MSRPSVPDPEFVPLIALAHRLNRALQEDMARQAHLRGYPEVRNAHNAVFATLDPKGSRSTDMAAQAGITRQSMGEVIREMVEFGMVEMKPDPDDRRAKLVTWTEKGLRTARDGYQYILELEERCADEFGEEEWQRIRAAMARITEMLREDEDR